MIELRAVIRDERVLEAFRRAPRAMERFIDQGLSRAGQEVAREEKRAAPKATSLLTNSIRAIRVSAWQQNIAPGVDYAPMVELGTGPGGGPSSRSILDWIKVQNIRARTPGIETRERLAFVIAASIRRHGTKAQPFAEPTAKKMQSRVFDLVRQSALRGAAQVFGG